MRYLNDRELRSLPVDWSALVDGLQTAVSLVDAGDYAQPVKPYLRYKDPQNRIIAMPAYIGGTFNLAGIKWIASFPNNIRRGLPRAHSVIVLNDADTGKPEAILNSPLPSVVRTAAVSGLLLRHYLRSRTTAKLKVGIIGWGPVGRQHALMMNALYGDQIDSFQVYDLRGVDAAGVPSEVKSKVLVADSWEEVFAWANVFVTCTVSDRRYIDRMPPEDALLLHVSLRDYRPETIAPIKRIIVDDWHEVCRENTDIEQLYVEYGLTQAHTLSLTDVVCRGGLNDLALHEPVLFCPMGLAVFDLVTALYYLEQAMQVGSGSELE